MLIIVTQIGLDERHSPLNPLQSAHSKAPPHVESNSSKCPEDSFCTYLEREEEKGKVAESQQEDTNDILLFVGLLPFPLYWYAHVDNIGCSTLCHCCDTCRSVHPRLEARPTRQVGVLSRQITRTSRRRGQVSDPRPSPTLRRSVGLFPVDGRRFNQLVLVFEPGRQPHVHSARIIAAAMGASIQRCTCYPALTPPGENSGNFRC